MNEKILHCPFCGNDNVNWIYVPTDKGTMIAVWCENCKAYGPRKSTESSAIADWNTRIIKNKAKEKAAYPTEEFMKAIEAWKKFFPGKQQPRPDNLSHRNKFATRWRDKFFRENWYSAMQRGSKSTFLQSSGFFSFQWFLGDTKKHGLHVEKILSGAYDDNKGRKTAYAIDRDAEKEWSVVEKWIKVRGSGREPEPGLLSPRSSTAINLAGGYKKLCMMEAQYAKSTFFKSYKEAADRS